MTKSRTVEVNVTQSTLIGQTAQATANSAASGVTNLNDPNLMSVIEKQTQVSQYAGLTSQYNVILARAKDANISTTDLTTAYNNLSTFMETILTDTTKASDVDRAAYKILTDAYNTALSNVQTSLSNSYNTDISNMQSSVSVASQAASSAAIVASQATVIGNSASQVASQAVVAASQAQSAGDNATSVANTASQAASNAVIVGSAAAVKGNEALSAASQAQSAGDNATSVANNVASIANSAKSTADSTYAYANSEISSNSTATAKAQSTADSAFSQAQAVGSQASAEIAVQSTATAKAQSTADSAFSQATTAIDNGEVTSQAVTALKDGSTMTIAELENGLATKVANSDYASYKTQTASQIGEMVTNGAFSAYQQTAANLIASKVANSDFSAYQATTAKSIDSKVSSSDFNTYKTQTADAISSKVESSDFKAYKTQVDNSAVGTNLLTNLSSNWIQSWISSGTIGTTPTFSSSSTRIRNLQTISVSSSFSYTISISDTSFKLSWLELDSNGNITYVAPWITSANYTFTTTSTTTQLYMVVAYKTDAALDTSNLPKIKLEKGSVATDFSLNPEDQATQSQITQLSGEIEQKVNSGDFSTYKTQTASEIASKVDNSAFSTYKTQTADLIAQKVATSDFSAYQATTAKEISSKVESSDFSTYKTQTDNTILSKVSKSDANNVNLIPYSAMPNADNLQWTESGTGGTLSVTKHAYYHNGADSLYELNTAGSTEVFAESPRFKINANTTYTFQLKGFASSNVSNMDVYVLGRPNGSTSDFTVAQKIIAAAALSTSALDYRTVTFTTGAIDEAYLRIDNNGSTNGSASILGFTELKLEPGDTATLYVYDGQDSMISQMSDDIILRVTKDDLVDQINIQAGNTLISSSGQLTLSGKSVLLDSVNPVVMKSANIGNLAVGTAQIADAAITNAKIGSLAVDTANIKDAAISSAKIASLAVGTAQIADAAITNAKIGSLAVGTAQIANAAITDAQVGSVSANKLTAGTIDFNTITGKNINASNITTGTMSTDRLNVGKLSALSANLGDVTAGSLKGVDIVASTFSTPNGSFTTDSSGAVVAKNMTLSGGTLTSPTINASTINGSTVNGTTFNGGSQLNQYGNTSYPLTINPDGSITSTSFKSIGTETAALRTVIQNGAVETKLRAMTPFATGKYSAADAALGIGEVALFAGYSTSQDPNFSATGMTKTGYVILDADIGLSLHGDTQQINFNGMSTDTTPKGVAFTPYGNINATGTQATWYVGYSNSLQTASFGIDSAGSNPITFSRDLWVSNMGLGTAHQVKSKDGGGIYFTDDDSNRVDTYHKNIYYTGSASKSLLSEKTNVTAADINYWSNLAMSIDLATYNYDTDAYTDPLRLSGIIDDVNATKEWTLPEAFYARDEDDNIVGIDNGVLLNAVLALSQEQAKQIDQLNGHLLELEAKLNG